MKRRWRDPEYAQSQARKIVLGNRHGQSRLEDIVEALFVFMSEPYERQKTIGKYTVDFYLPERDLVVEVNGCYWHKCKECGVKDDRRKRFSDARRYRSLRSRGHEVCVLWEHDILRGEFGVPIF